MLDMACSEVEFSPAFDLWSDQAEGGVGVPHPFKTSFSHLASTGTSDSCHRVKTTYMVAEQVGSVSVLGQFCQRNVGAR